MIRLDQTRTLILVALQPFCGIGSNGGIVSIGVVDAICRLDDKMR